MNAYTEKRGIIMKIDFIELPIDDVGNSLHLSLLRTDDKLILIDAGYPNMAKLIDEKLREKGYSLEEVNEIWITHHDHDHIGSLAEIVSEYPNIVVRASEPEIPYIAGELMSLRLSQAIEGQEELVGEEYDAGIGFQNYLKSIVSTKVDSVLEYGDALNGSVVVLDTSGHTDGHISFYVPEEELLIAGDLIAIVDGEVVLPFPQYSYELERAVESIIEVSKRPLKTVHCYHGGVIEGSADEIKSLMLKAVNI